MKRRNVLFMVLLVIVILFRFGWSEEKWGSVSKEVLQMSSYPKDTSAVAFILFDLGDVEITSNFELVMKRHTRIKILKEEGKKFADIKIPYWHKDEIKSLEAHVILPNGKKIELDDDDVYEESYKRIREKVFTMPGVEAGCVIEYKYKKFSEYLHFLEPWYFQHEIPTQYSRLTVILLPGFRYNVLYENMYKDDVKHHVEEFLSARQRQTMQKFIWEKNFIPALRKEPYMLTLNDYRQALQFQLIDFKNAYTYVKFIEKWDDLAKKMFQLLDSFLDEKDEIKNIVLENRDTTLSEIDQIKKYYDFVRSEIETDWYFTIYPEKTPVDVLKNKKGNVSEKNILLVNLLRSAGFDAFPFLISTRDNGTITINHPQLLQFNLILACVKVGSKTLYLDAGDRYCPFNLLPPYSLVENGLFISKKGGKIFKIPPPKSLSMQSFSTKAELTEAGELICNSNIRYQNYSAVTKRKQLDEEKPNEQLTEWLQNRFAGAVLDSFRIINRKNIDDFLVIQVHYRVPDFAQVAGNNMYLSLPLMTRTEKNPFQSEERRFPVEFNYYHGFTEDIKLKIPQEYKILDMPQAKMLNLDNIKYGISCTQDGEVTKIFRQHLARDLKISSYYYNDLRNLYAGIVNADQGQIVLTSDSTTVVKETGSGDQ